MIGEERDTEPRLDKQLIPQKLRNRRQNLILGTQSLMNAAADVNTALMNTVKYFTLLALAAATLGVSACCGEKETPPPQAPAPSLSK